MGLVTIRTPSGAAFQVDEAHAPRFQGFLSDLEGSGYAINGKESGGYNYRTIAGTNKLSNHAHGSAIDINWGANARGTPGNMPPEVRDLAQRHGLTWGGDWKNPDPMHFEVPGAAPHTHDAPTTPKIAAALTGQGPAMTAAPMISATYDPNELTPEAVALQRKLAMQLIGQGTDISPVGHPLAALARAVQGGIGGYQIGKANEAELRAKAREAASLQQMLGSVSAGQTPSVAMSQAPMPQRPPMTQAAPTAPAQAQGPSLDAMQGNYATAAAGPAMPGTSPPLPAPMGPNGQRLITPSEARQQPNPQAATPRGQTRLSEEAYNQLQMQVLSNPAYINLPPDRKKIVDTFLAQRAPMAPKLEKAGDTIVDLTDPSNPKIVFSGDKKGERQSDYDFYVKQTAASGGRPKSFEEWDLQNRRASVAQPENSFENAAAKVSVTRLEKLVEAGDTARGFRGQMDILREHSRNIGNAGAAAPLKQALGPYATALGIPIDRLDDIQAFNSIIEKVAPTMRAPGSGATSDIEYKGFLKSLPQMSATAQGREMIINQLSAIARDSEMRAEVSSRVLNGEIGRKQADEVLRKLPDVMSTYREYQKTQPQQPPVGSKPVKVNSPEEAAALPPGTPFISHDGREMVKR